MRKVFIFVIIFLGIVVILKANDFPCKPKPIILIHGYNGNSRSWGVRPYKPPGEEFNSDSIIYDKICSDSTYEFLLQFMNPYAIEWWKIDKSYTHPDSSPAYPNKAFLEIYNFKHPLGSFDPDAGGGFPPWAEQEGWGTELRGKIEKTLKEYYGSDWANDPEAKVILIGHSTGGLATREALNSVHRYSLFAERRTNNPERKKEWFYVLSLN